MLTWYLTERIGSLIVRGRITYFSVVSRRSNIVGREELFTFAPAMRYLILCTYVYVILQVCRLCWSISDVLVPSGQRFVVALKCLAERESYATPFSNPKRAYQLVNALLLLVYPP